MGRERSIERRRIARTGLALEPSFLFRLPPRIAWPLLVVLLAATALADTLFLRRIWFGPFYMVALALAAWSFGIRAGIALGIAIMSVKYIAGAAYYPVGPIDDLANLAVKVLGIGIVVGFIGLARKSCETEWHSARTDNLTGVMNRQAFFEFLESGQGSDGWSAIIYADLDGLKALNDKYGHAQGDRSLKAFVERVSKTIRKDDVLARMGGDEFVIFMKLADEASGTAVCNRLHKAINLDGDPDSHRLTCSLGVLVLPNGSHSIDAELRAADQLMYMAKQSRCGAIVATARDRGGELLLDTTTSIREAFDLATPVRQIDRDEHETLSAVDSPTDRPRPRAA